MEKFYNEVVIKETQWVLNPSDFSDILKDLKNNYSDMEFSISDFTEARKRYLDDMEKYADRYGNEVAYLFDFPVSRVHGEYLLEPKGISYHSGLWFDAGDILVESRKIFRIKKRE